MEPRGTVKTGAISVRARTTQGWTRIPIVRSGETRAKECTLWRNGLRTRWCCATRGTACVVNLGVVKHFDERDCVCHMLRPLVDLWKKAITGDCLPTKGVGR